MKIATWNLERLKKGKNGLILEKLHDIDAEICVLTETSSAIQLENYVCIATELLPADFDGVKYKAGENRVSIWTKYKASTRHETFDKYTTVCTDLDTPFGLLTVYGTIIGVFANRQPRFDNDLDGQLADFDRLFPGKQCCIAGDFNTTFSGRVYPSHKARNSLKTALQELGLTNTTAPVEANVDHIVLSGAFLVGKKRTVEVWNTDKALSDHIGLCLTLTAE